MSRRGFYENTLRVKGCRVAGVEISSPQLHHNLCFKPFDSGSSCGVSRRWPAGIERVVPIDVTFCGVAAASPLLSVNDLPVYGALRARVGMTKAVNLPPHDFDSDGARAGGWWYVDEHDPERIVCDLCPRRCHLRPGDRGFCFVRENRNGAIYLTTYGRSTGFCVDPIEKKPLNHFYPGTSVLSFGTAGCNLACKFCQNWSISKSREVERLSELALPDAVAAAAHDLDCRSVAFTYNDPIIWAEYAIDVAARCRQQGLRTVAVTAGYITDAAREPFFRAFDAANVDLKGFTEEFYERYTLSHLQPVLDTLEWIARETDIWLEVTNLIIPRANDNADSLRRMCDWVVDRLGPHVPLHFSAFHPDFRMRDREATPIDTLLEASAIARQAGSQFVYVGNVHDEKHQSTYCPSCGTRLIERDWYQLGEYHLNENRCGACRAIIPGHFDVRPGTWGRRRLPVPMKEYVERTMVGNEQKSVASKSDQQGCVELTEPQRQEVLRFAAQQVADAVGGLPSQNGGPELAAIGAQNVLGCFVTLKRGHHLRACCGFLGSLTPLAQAVTRAAITTATQDVRLPPLSTDELPYLSVTVSLLHNMQRVDVSPSERSRVVEVGRHGLQIHAKDQRGLLLPSVATENGLDADGFLRQVCLKAGLPPYAWKEESTDLYTFEGLLIDGPFDFEAASKVQGCHTFELTDQHFAALLRFCRDNVLASARGALPGLYLPDCPDGMVAGVTLIGRHAPSGLNWQAGRFALRPGVPLQATLSEFTTSLGTRLRATLSEDEHARVEVNLAILDSPTLHGVVGDVETDGWDPSVRAAVVQGERKTAWHFDPQCEPNALIEQAARQVGLRSGHVTSLRVWSSCQPIGWADQPRPSKGVPNRPPAVAGTFYPADQAELGQQLDQFVAEMPIDARGSWPAAMIPHAGWRFSGRLAWDVLRRIDLPSTIIVIGPKHTGLGMNWAVAPHDRWDFPGGSVEAEPTLAEALAREIPELELDAAAHQREHAIEVAIPLLARLAPTSHVVGIAIGNGDWTRCQEAASRLANVCRQLAQPPLLLISSDMNHFATDRENRRLDALALDAMAACDPTQLWEVVRGERISMCGILPALLVMETTRLLGGLTEVERVGYATSSDVTGDTSRVVGYAGVLIR